MSKIYIYSCIFLMAVITYIIRIIPVSLFKKPISSKFIRSFLYYAPYVTLSVLIFPDILSCTGNCITSLCCFACAVIMTLITGNFVITTFAGCILVFILQLVF